jgi:hypothetical protein
VIRAKNADFTTLCVHSLQSRRREGSAPAADPPDHRRKHTQHRPPDAEVGGAGCQLRRLASRLTPGCARQRPGRRLGQGGLQLQPSPAEFIGLLTIERLFV